MGGTTVSFWLGHDTFLDVLFVLSCLAVFVLKALWRGSAA